MRGGKREGAGRKLGSVARIDAEARQRALASGLTPLDYLLSIMRDESQDRHARLDAAKAAAPYCHARLASTELSGPDGAPIQTLAITDEERARALAAFLAKTKAFREEKA
jgi:hypothetical protein